MTPGARLSAAMAVLDRVLAGEAAEKALVNWARKSRYAGSGDRHAVRDHVFDALRQMRSGATLGGSLSGRGLMLGVLRSQGIDPTPLFTGEGHAPAPVTEEDAPREMTELEALDCADWLAPRLQASLGDKFAPILRLMQARAPVFLRVNARKSDLSRAQHSLAMEDIVTRTHPLAPLALEVVEGTRKVGTSAAFSEGWVELQDVASQVVVDALPMKDGQKILDYCAGGGGKALAMAARKKVQVVAYDVDADRMVDIRPRAKRAGVEISLAAGKGPQGLFDLVLADAPCSGSGSWRRAPEAHWRFTEERLLELMAIQDEVLDSAKKFVAPGGALAYATCSLLTDENDDRANAFLAANPDFSMEKELHLTPLDGGDGFYLAVMRRAK